MHMCVQMHAHMCVDTYGSQNSTLVVICPHDPPHTFVCLFIYSLSLGWNSPSSIDWPASEPQGSTCPCPFYPRIFRVHHHAWFFFFYVGSVEQIQVLVLAKQAFYLLTSLLRPLFYKLFTKKKEVHTSNSFFFLF